MPRRKSIRSAKNSINSKFGSATIQRGSSMQSSLDIGKKHRAQMEFKQKK